MKFFLDECSSAFMGGPDLLGRGPDRGAVGTADPVRSMIPGHHPGIPLDTCVRVSYPAHHRLGGAGRERSEAEEGGPDHGQGLPRSAAAAEPGARAAAAPSALAP